jgi:hypothetical protein
MAVFLSTASTFSPIGSQPSIHGFFSNIIATQSIEHLAHMRVAREESAMRIHIRAAVVVAADAFELAAAQRAIFVDQAAVVSAEKNASAIAVGKRQFGDDVRAVVNRHGDGESRKSTALVIALKQNRIVMAILFAASGDA